MGGDAQVQRGRTCSTNEHIEKYLRCYKVGSNDREEESWRTEDQMVVMCSRRRLMDSGDARYEFGHRGRGSKETSRRSGTSASPGLVPLVRSSWTTRITAKQGAVALSGFLTNSFVRSFIHSISLDLDVRRSVINSFKTSSFRRQKRTAFTLSLFTSRTPSATGSSQDWNLLHTVTHQICAHTFVGFVQ
jgi:hypothetical protein